MYLSAFFSLDRTDHGFSMKMDSDHQLDHSFLTNMNISDGPSMVEVVCDCRTPPGRSSTFNLLCY